MTVADGAVVGQGDTATIDFGIYITYDAQSLEQCTIRYFIEQSVAGARGIVLDGMATTIEGASQIYLLFPAVQFNVPKQVERSGHIVHIHKVLGGIDEPARLRLESDIDIMSRHDERKGIAILGIVRKRQAVTVAAVDCRCEDAVKMVVAGDAHRSGNRGTGYS